jgi:hypothetical protein
VAQLQRRNAQLTFVRHELSDHDFDDWPAQEPIGDTTQRPPSIQTAIYQQAAFEIGQRPVRAGEVRGTFPLDAARPDRRNDWRNSRCAAGYWQLKLAERQSRSLFIARRSAICRLTSKFSGGSPTGSSAGG